MFKPSDNDLYSYIFEGISLFENAVALDIGCQHAGSLKCIKEKYHLTSECIRIIICIHRDWESIVFNSRNKSLINKTIYGYANFLQSNWMDGCNGWIGRWVWSHFNKTGLFNGTVKIYNSIETDLTESNSRWQYIHDMNYFIKPKSFLTEAEYTELIEDMKNTYTCGEYIYMLPHYIYTERKK